MLSEEGADRVESVMGNSVLSAVNYAEVVGKLLDRGVDAKEVVSDIADLGIQIIAVDRELAEIAARMRVDTRATGLSLGDRVCLALAFRLKTKAMTTDRAWGAVADRVGVDIEVVR